MRDRSRSPSLGRLNLRTPRRLRNKCTPVGSPVFYGKSSQSQDGQPANLSLIEDDCTVLEGMIKDGDNWLGRARALQEEPPNNQSPFRQNPIPGIGRSQHWYATPEPVATPTYSPSSQGLVAPLNDVTPTLDYRSEATQDKLVQVSSPYKGSVSLSQNAFKDGLSNSRSYSWSKILQIHRFLTILGAWPPLPPTPREGLFWNS